MYFFMASSPHRAGFCIDDLTYVSNNQKPYQYNESNSIRYKSAMKC